ncbi:hypothetical protein XA68_12747 [Ophiocordyceps unilateralis]|uniref:Nephrocystin 3-like N-terminal domain-containing protein n=1 Tax=Ophiocordyceps unilateralis TaxID=268505 RepID=A0A2A9PE37_OPHUN|nr:hypothetical protein XA68_12747 [Ophiocordyceps unilateralis]
MNRFVDASQPDTMELSVSEARLRPHNYHESVPRPLPPKIEVMRFWSGIFPNAMARLHHLPALRRGGDSGYDIRGLETWEEVHDRLCQARSAYEFSGQKQGKGAKMMDKLRKGARKGMDNTVSPLQEVIKMMPSNDIASPIVGGIKVLLEAYKRAADFRQELMSEFDDLSDAFIDIDFNVTRFPDDQNIITASEKLLLSILRAVEHAICFYTGYQVLRGIAAVGRGDKYQQSLRDSLAEIKSCKEFLDRESRKSESYNNDRSQQSNRHVDTYMMHAINHILLLLQEKEKQNEERALAYHAALPPRTSGSLPVAAGHWNQLPPFAQLLPQNQSMASYLTNRSQDVRELLDIPSFDEDDLRHVLSRAGRVPAEDRGRAEQIVDTSLFSRWLLSQQTAKLLIHGDFDSADDVSPLSVFCATLVQTLRSRSEYMTLVFFCGLHQDRDRFLGPAAMIRSLIEQLLRQSSAHPSWLSTQVSLDRVAKGNVSELCRLFGVLARSLPPHLTILCFIDGIQIYERTQYRTDMERVLCSILSAAEDVKPGRSAPIKILLTSPRATRHIRQLFVTGSTLLSMAAVPHTGHVPSPLRLNRQLGGMRLQDRAHGDD